MSYEVTIYTSNVTFDMSSSVPHTYVSYLKIKKCFVYFWKYNKIHENVLFFQKRKKNFKYSFTKNLQIKHNHKEKVSEKFKIIQKQLNSSESKTFYSSRCGDPPPYFVIKGDCVGRCPPRPLHKLSYSKEILYVVHFD